MSRGAGNISKITVEEALGIAGKREIDRLRGLFASTKLAIEERRNGDALKLCRQALNGPTIDLPASADRPCDTQESA